MTKYECTIRGFSNFQVGNSSRTAQADTRSQEPRRAMTKYECTICGYIYDPAKGDPDGGVDPGTAFEDIPDDWVCPECGATKDAFEPLD